MEHHPRLSRDPADFSRFTPGPCKWFVGSGWKQGRIVGIHADRLLIKAEAPVRSVIVSDARNVEQQ